MYKIWIIFEREYLQRVKKKSFLIGTLLTPLIFPLFIGITIFFFQVMMKKSVLYLVLIIIH
jgi:ABC-2 type transport system permease protein